MRLTTTHLSGMAEVMCSASMSLRMSRAWSLSSRERIGEILKKGARVSSGAITLMYLSHSGVAGATNAVNSRWTFMISKRVGGAVVRNRCRRALREDVRLWPNRPAFRTDVIVRVNDLRVSRVTIAQKARVDVGSLRRDLGVILATLGQLQTVE